MRPGRRLGIDVGDVRIGVAVCDPEGLVATDVETVPAGADSVSALTELARQYQAIECVVGLPLSLSGAEGPAAAKVRAFAGQLASHVAVRLFDERLSTVEAAGQLRSGGVSERKQRTVIDQAAARVILQSALDAERSSGNLPGWSA